MKKPLLLLALFAAINRLHADDPPSAPPAAPRAVEAAAPASPAPAVVPAAAAPPAAATGAEPASETVTEPPVPAGLSFEPARETPPPAETTAEPAAAELRFSDRLLADPEADLSAVRIATNALRIQGIGARAVKPSKFGSFFQLFNPLAPVSEGMEAQPVYWYDGQLNSAAKPRGLRDEKTETPVGGVVISVGK